MLAGTGHPFLLIGNGNRTFSKEKAKRRISGFCAVFIIVLTQDGVRGFFILHKSPDLLN